MHAEHEEAMRADFVEVDRLRSQAYELDYSCPESRLLRGRATEIDRRWIDGPHWDDWIYLAELSDLATNPRVAEDMRQFLGEVERGEAFDHEINLRSMRQALAMAEARGARTAAALHEPQSRDPRVIQRER